MAHTSVNKVVQEIINHGVITLLNTKTEITNLIASTELHKNIDLETTADILADVFYDPEKYPWVIYHMNKPQTVLFLFKPGKIVCTGALSEEMVYNSIRNIVDILNDYDLLY